jgi:hypothetical protein
MMVCQIIKRQEPMPPATRSANLCPKVDASLCVSRQVLILSSIGVRYDMVNKNIGAMNKHWREMFIGGFKIHQNNACEINQ